MRGAIWRDASVTSFCGLVEYLRAVIVPGGNSCRSWRRSLSVDCVAVDTTVVQARRKTCIVIHSPDRKIRTVNKNRIVFIILSVVTESEDGSRS